MIIYIFCLKEYHAAIFYFCSVSLSITMLYLCLGFVVFKLNNVSNVKDMGGLFFKMPAMFLFTLIAFFSISGIPFFSGYYSNQVIFSSLYFSQEVLLIPSLLLGISFSFLISYILLKNILLIFFGNNKGNIHQFNKVNENSFINKFIFLCLGLCVVFAGWLTKNLFDGANAEYLWSLLIYNDVSFSISAEVNSSENFKDLLILFSLVGIFFAVVNYIIMPIILNNYKLKYYKIFILYNKYFLRF
jgi:NADH-quinone oxidoreductase subunit L